MGTVSPDPAQRTDLQKCGLLLHFALSPPPSAPHPLPWLDMLVSWPDMVSLPDMGSLLDMAMLPLPPPLCLCPPPTLWTPRLRASPPSTSPPLLSLRRSTLDRPAMCPVMLPPSTSPPSPHPGAHHPPWLPECWCSHRQGTDPGAHRERA